MTNILSIKTNAVLIGPLANNGGPTMTMGLLAGSPAIDAAGTNTATFPPTDQRGVPRPIGKGCDIGAYELVTAPVILVPPQNQPLTYGSPVTFTVSAVGDALNPQDTLKYRWQLDGANITGGVLSTYTVLSAVTTNYGPYLVIVTNNYGAVTSSVAYVQFAPYITLPPTNTTVLQGGTTNFFVNAGGDLTLSSPLSYQWQFNGTNLTVGATNSVFMVFGDPTNAGNYTVAITNLYGSITSTPPATLTVGVLPFIQSQPVDVIAEAGASVSFSVTAGGSLPLTYQWFFNNNFQQGATAPSLTFNAGPNAAGLYYVTVGNPFGTIASVPVTLTVVGIGYQTNIIQPQLVSNEFSFFFQSYIGFAYIIESKTNLTDPSWTPLATNSGSGGLMQFSDPSIGGLSRFYRILVQ